MLLEVGFRMALFALGLGVSGNWQETVLDSYAISCTMLPHPAPYPSRLLQLADGHFTIKGVKELFACDYEPLLGFERVPRPRIVLGDSK